MLKSNLLMILAGAGAAFAWWPVVIVPGSDLPLWLPLVIVALVTAFSTLLSGGHWPRFLLASAVGTFSGVCSGWAIWRIPDQIAALNVQHRNVTEVVADCAFVAVATLAAAIVSLSVGIAVRRFSLTSSGLRRAIWISLSGTLMLPPIALALTPRLVALRIERNNSLASIRFEALKRAVDEVRSETNDPSRICDGTLLERHYSGPHFDESDWRFMIGGNSVIEDDYLFGMKCHDETGRFTIYAQPMGDSGHGVRRFCTDESGVVGCRIDTYQPRGECLPCAK